MNAVARCRDELMSLLAASDVNNVAVDEAFVREKYSKETKHIKVGSRVK